MPLPGEVKGEEKRKRKKPSRLEKLSHLDAALAEVKSFRLAVDAGAHVGAWTEVMARRFDRVVAFEPLPINQERWRRTMAGVENAELVCAALGDQKVMTTLHGGEQHSKHFCVKDPAGDVPMLRLDDFGFADLDFLKIDTEGADALVIRGAWKTIRRCRPVIIVESVGRFEARYGLAEGAPLALLESLGAVRVAHMWCDYIYVFPS